MDGGDMKEGSGGREEVPADKAGGAEVPAMPSELDEVEDEGGISPGPGVFKADTAPGAALEAAPESANIALPKASVLNRAIARAIDILFALLLAQLPGYIGFLAGLLYIAIADGLMGGRSIGKRIIGLRAVQKKDGRPADFRASILRNSTIGLLYILHYIPYAGWALALVGLGIESLLMIGSAEGMRLGDEIAQTVVIEDTKK
jgi:uncharacterized RDD family membrane protein YckC